LYKAELKGGGTFHPFSEDSCTRGEGEAESKPIVEAGHRGERKMCRKKKKGKGTALFTQGGEKRGGKKERLRWPFPPGTRVT